MTLPLPFLAKPLDKHGKKVHSLNSGKVPIQIQLKALPELNEWTLSH